MNKRLTLQTCTYTRTHTHTHVYIYIYNYLFVYTHVCIYMCIYIYIYIYIYVCVYRYIHMRVLCVLCFVCVCLLACTHSPALGAFGSQHSAVAPHVGPPIQDWSFGFLPTWLFMSATCNRSVNYKGAELCEPMAMLDSFRANFPQLSHN